eukprot:5422765-Amphidinium_carterae.1
MSMRVEAPGPEKSKGVCLPQCWHIIDTASCHRAMGGGCGGLCINVAILDLLPSKCPVLLFDCSLDVHLLKTPVNPFKSIEDLTET